MNNSRYQPSMLNSNHFRFLKRNPICVKYFNKYFFNQLLFASQLHLGVARTRPGGRLVTCGNRTTAWGQVIIYQLAVRSILDQICSRIRTEKAAVIMTL